MNLPLENAYNLSPSHQPSPDDFEEPESHPLKQTTGSCHSSGTPKTHDPMVLEDNTSRRVFPVGVEMTDERRRRMEEVIRETKENFQRHDRENSWFFPEYLAFIERGVSFLSA